MDEVIKTAVLGLVQGLTEFLPVSSSGHLVLAERFIGMERPGNILEVLLHAGTLLAVLVFYRHRIADIVTGFFRGEKASLGYVAALAVGTVPAAAIYMAAGRRIEQYFEKPVIVSVFLCVTGLVLLSLKFANSREKESGLVTGLLTGIAQAIALLPGISRSGMTITAARHLGLNAAAAAEFSFLLAVPALAGAVAVKAAGIMTGTDAGLAVVPACAGFLVAAVSGYAALSLLMRILSADRFWLFGFYCIAAGLTAFFLLA